MNDERFKVLVIEDRKQDRELLKYYIEKASPHFKVYTCESSDCAKQYIMNNSIDFVVLDIQIPEVDAGEASDDIGIDLLNKICEHDRWSPVLVFTIHPESMYQNTSFEYGAISYIQKDMAGDFPKQITNVVVPVITSVWNAKAKISKEYEEKRENYVTPFRELALDIFKSFTLSEAIPPHEYVETDVISPMQTVALRELFSGIVGNTKILEVGCGKGRFLSHLNEHVIKNNPELEGKISYIGIDPHEKMIKEAEDKCCRIQIKHEFLNCSIEDYKRTCSEKFDIIVSINVIHEIPSKDLLTFIRCMISLLNSQGILSLTDMGDLPEPEPCPVLWNLEEFCNILEYLGYSKSDYTSILVTRKVPIWNILVNNKKGIKEKTMENWDILENMLHKKINESIGSIEKLQEKLEESDPTKIRYTDGIRSFIKSSEDNVKKYIIEYSKLVGYVKNWMEISNKSSRNKARNKNENSQ